MKKLMTLSRMASTSSAAAMGFALLAAGATPAWAQDADETATDAAAPAQADDETNDEAIVITGFRASLESAIAQKKNRDLIIESVSAEDIGKLPDASIGESIARLPGLTSQRLNGRSAFISVRGFGPDFSQTLLNGREQTSTGDNRAVEFDQYASEMVSRVDVYKTPSANLIGQGLVGTIDIRTARPLDVKDKLFAVGIKGSHTELGKLNSGSKEYGYRVNATYIDRFGSDDEMGIALSASYVDEPYQVEEYNAWGWGQKGDVGGNFLINGNKSFVTSTRLKRLGLTGTFQGEIGNDLVLTLDGYYSKFDDDIIKRGIELPLGDSLGWTSTTITNYEVEDGTVVSGTFGNIEAVVNNHSLKREADLGSFGANLAWNPGNGWKGFLDWGYSKTDRNELVFESNAGTGRGQGVGALDDLDFTCNDKGCVFTPTLDYSDPNLIQLTSPMGWGGIAGGQDGYYNNRIVLDKLEQYRGELEREMTGFFKAARIGINYTDRDKSLTPEEYFVLLSSGADQQAVPEQYLLKPTNLDYIGLGPVISYDPNALLAAGFYDLVPNPSADIPKKAYTVSENLLTGYLMFDIDHEIKGGVITGNIGVQAAHTDQSSEGPLFAGGVLERAELGDKYWDILPSANVSVRLDSDWVFRLGLARQMQRPRLDDMRVAFDYGFDNGTQSFSGSGGNPYLRPYRANAVDVTVEKYFGTRGYIALQGFYKDLKNFIYNQEVEFDYAGLPYGGGTIPDGIPGRITQPVNAKGGKIYGAEFAGTIPFGEFVHALDGFGFTGGVSYTKSRVRPSPSESYGDIPGYSKWVANGTLYFEKWGFNARASARYRSTFIGEFSGFGGNRVRRRALGETIIDAQIGYDFKEGSSLEGLSVYLQGQNLTDEPFSTINPGEPLQVIDYQTYGRRWQAGATFKF